MKRYALFLSNKYSRWYSSIINKAKSENRVRKLGLYYEKHHVLPKCMYPDLIKDKDNIVLLTAREHFICHWLRPKMVSNERYRQQLLNALGRMMQSTSKHERIVSGWRYEVCRKAFSVRSSAIMSSIHKGKTISVEHRKQISSSLTGRHHTTEAKEKIGVSKRGVPRSDETKIKVRLGVLEYINKNGGPANLGSHWSEASKSQLKAKFKKFGHPMYGRKNPAPLVTCPHCAMTLSARPAGRWHFDNCKLRVSL